jgi:integrase
MQLTAKSVRELPLPEGKSDHVYWDDTITGLGLRIRASGARVLIFQYGRQPTRRMKLGKVGAVSLEEARSTAKTLHLRVQLGEDPAAEVAERKTEKAETFEAVLKTYLTWKRRQVRASTMSEVERHLLVYAAPLHGTPLIKLERRQVAAVLTTLAQDSGDVTANRVRSSICAFLGWAIGQGIIDVNVAIGTNRQEEKARNRVLEESELRTVWNALPAGQFGSIVKLLVLTGQRADEIAGLQWKEVREDRIELPGERTKNGKPHMIPLSGPARAILDAQPRQGSEFVFPSLTGRAFRSWARHKSLLDAAIAKASGEPLKHWTIHDLRRTTVTHMGEIGILPHVVEAVINHISGHKAGVAGTYNYATYEPERRTALARWAEHITAVVEDRPSNVEPLRRA